MYNGIIYDCEIFKDINIDGIAPIYQISNYGNVQNKITGEIENMYLTRDGYLRIFLQMEDGSRKAFLVHRLVMMTFHPISNHEEMQVNHKRGIKTNNRDYELEWATPLENVRHAYATGLNNNVLENNHNAILTNEQVVFICEQLSKGVQIHDIVQMLGDTGCVDIERNIRSIYERKAWTRISQNYTFPQIQENRRNLFTPSEVKIICEKLQEGYGYIDILKFIGMDIDRLDKDSLFNFCNVISNIRMGKYYKDISKNYDLIPDNGRDRYDQTFSADKIEIICQLLENGMTYSDILLNLGIDRSCIDKTEYDKYRHFLYRIKNRKIFRDISDKYKF